ncbi:helix-turn-helix transcriptional regulator [Asanoa siamensis]|uniref:Transcriptional regulator n=1 Tax=Asanoa siamensis TaxID=926357 RepID=A0ABQ4D310_9ACTN|nr:helix-turn-helix transcriptional regulator [Asanoa siamensis]GIF77923.1 transcriptional regulator [Asanoa siamensis]
MEITKLPAEARARRAAEMRDFLRSRRARVTPAEAGLAVGDGRSRRTPGLRREEVAVLANVGVSWYTWLEQGREINISGDVLDSVARVLLLSTAERAHLYLLAGLNPPLTPAATTRDVSDGVRRMIDSWMPRPAYLLDRHWNLVAVNRGAEIAFGYRPQDHNCLITFFASAYYRSLVKHWDEAAEAIVGQFRADAARYPEDPEFGRIADDMCAASPEFAEIWAEHLVCDATSGTKTVVHPDVGELTFDYTTVSLPELPGHRLMLQTPADVASEKALTGLLAAPTS